MSKIEWTQKTLNPILGCSKVSPGCGNCYAIQMAYRCEKIALGLIAEGKNPGRLRHYIGLTKEINRRRNWTGKVQFVPEALEEVFNRKKPTIWFVNSMSDLFHEDVKFEDIDQIMAAIGLTPYHQYQILTKRPERMYEYFLAAHDTSFRAMCKMHGDYELGRNPDHWYSRSKHLMIPFSDCMKGWPFPNLWLGVSVENQEAADTRIPYLLKTPAAVHFLSCEPLLEEIEIDPLELQTTGKDKGIDWIIIGGESHQSPKQARPFHLEWAKSLIEQCQENGVKVFFKQAGSNPYYQGKPLKLKDKKGGDLSELPEFCQVREMPIIKE